MIALISALSQVFLSYFDQEPCDNQALARHALDIRGRRGVAEKAAIFPVMELSQTINAIRLFAWIQNVLESGFEGFFLGAIVTPLLLVENISTCHTFTPLLEPRS
jgi:hypothetical protein